MADIPLEGDIEIRLTGDDGTGVVRQVYVTDQHRFKVDAVVTSGGSGLVDAPVHELSEWGNNRTKINYTVPSGKKLFIQSIWAAHESDAAGHIIFFRADGTAFYYMAFSDDGTKSFNKDYPENNLLEFSAGTVITAYRQDGSSPEDWGAGFDGYLEDE